MKKIIMAVLVGLIALPAFAGNRDDNGYWLGGKKIDDNGRLQCEFREYKNGKPTTFWNPSFRHGLSPVCPNQLTRVAWGWHVITDAQYKYLDWSRTADSKLFSAIKDKWNEAKKVNENTLEVYTLDGTVVSVYTDAYVDYIQRVMLGMAKPYNTFVNNNIVRVFNLDEYNPTLQALYKSHADNWTPMAKARYSWLPQPRV